MKNRNPLEIDYYKFINYRYESIKGLECINRVIRIFNKGKSNAETLQEIAKVLPYGWQQSENTEARISFDSKIYSSTDFKDTVWKQEQEFITGNNKKGLIEIFYLSKFPDSDEGPFLMEERELIKNLANLLSGYLSGVKGNRQIEYPQQKDDYKYKKIIYKESFRESKQLLHQFISKQSADKNIYHDLMQKKVKEILLVATLYDAYILENEGGFFEQAMGEILHLSLSFLPRITGLTSPDEALDLLSKKNFDLVVLMAGNDLKGPVKLSKKIKEQDPDLQVFLLSHSGKSIGQYETRRIKHDSIDKIFVWNGDSRIFFSMVKLVEDVLNVENDTKIGQVRVILLIEDSPQFYSRLLSIVYSVVFEQTQDLIEEVSTSEIDKIFRMRARTKVLHATNYEEAQEYFNKYKESLSCVISDIQYNKNNFHDPAAGISFLKYAKSEIPELPVVLLSSDKGNSIQAFKSGASFIHKYSDSLVYDLKSFITYNLSFKHFVYLSDKGNSIEKAQSVEDFENQLGSIPDESLVYHTLKNHFSLWLMARGEIQIAKVINPVKATDFDSPSELRQYLMEVIHNYRMDKDRGKVISFDEQPILDEKNIVSFGPGSLGGKGRGLAFINMLINNIDFSEYIPDIEIRTPRTTIIGTDEFELFIENNNLNSVIRKENDYEKIKRSFINGDLSKDLIIKLKSLLKFIDQPLAIRSSSIFEDSTTQPFSGIFSTYIIPNDSKVFSNRLTQIMNAIKLVFASIFSDEAKSYFKAVNYKIEEEKMAIIIQELVGNNHESYYYPDISGTAQSYNYYPVAHMEPEDGFALAALGLGEYVVSGEKSFRFSPKFPGIEINSTEKLVENSQIEFIAVELGKENIDLITGEDATLKRLDISVAESHGTLKHITSVYDIQNDRIEQGLSIYGPRILNFADILKSNYIPLAKALNLILDVVTEAQGTPVEIEYAVDLKRGSKQKPIFYLLQIKPLVGSENDYNIDSAEAFNDNCLLYSQQSMGNGRIDNVCDVIFVDPVKFDKLNTEKIVEEINELNSQMISSNRYYILIGPGRWGTKDKFLGIPVKWPQISNAKVIVETSLEGFPLDASLGSHFFHNVTSMQVGYLSVQTTVGEEFVKWETLHKQEHVTELKYVKHVRFKKNLCIKMDGKKRISLISF